MIKESGINITKAAAFPAPFESGLEYNPHKGACGNIDHTGMLIPECSRCLSAWAVWGRYPHCGRDEYHRQDHG